MSTKQGNIDYKRIERAIVYISKNYRKQPSLEDIAAYVHMSPYHLQRLFKKWAGISPKKFLQYTSIEYAKRLLENSEKSLFSITHKAGLSSTSRLHDLFVKLEGMTPGEYRNKGGNLSINYSYSSCLFGGVFVASTEKGICYLGFFKTLEEGLSEVKYRFPNATFTQKVDAFQEQVLKIYTGEELEPHSIHLHLQGTSFQLKVWEMLLKIPMGSVTTYGNIAKNIGTPGASRAVGTAIGKNPVGFIIPCHRVIQSSGMFGNYMWGADRKATILSWEASQQNKDS